MKLMRFFIGDVRDQERMITAFHGVDIVFHASALKRIGECEYNPMEAIKTNIIGTENVIQAAIKNQVKYVLGLSTDKACNPVNLYGATKLCGEKLLVNANILGGGITKFCVIRYGNQLCSRGSIVEIFKNQKEQGRQLTVTDPTMTRFTILLQEAANFVLMCLDLMTGGEIFIPKLPSYSIEQMVKCFGQGKNYEVIGSRAGEKMHELMISSDESHTAYEFEKFFILVTLEEYQLQMFDHDAYGRFEFKQREAQQAYSSGDNYLISNQRLCQLIDEPYDSSYDNQDVLENKKENSSKTINIKKELTEVKKKLSVKVNKVNN